MARSIKNASERLFVCKMSTGIFYADRQVEENGDYKRLASLMYSTLELDIRKNIAPEFVELIKESAEKIQAMQGEQYQVSTSGQMITLGYAL